MRSNLWLIILFQSYMHHKLSQIFLCCLKSTYQNILQQDSKFCTFHLSFIQILESLIFMNPQLASAQPLFQEKHSTHPSRVQASLVNFVKEAWKRSVDLAERLILFTTQNGPSQNLKQVKSIPTEKSQHEFKLSTDEKITVHKDLKNHSYENQQKIQDRSKRFVDFTNYIKDSPNKEKEVVFRTKPVKRKPESRTKTLIIPNTHGYVNMQELLKKLQQQKNQKQERQRLKISRSEFKYIQCSQLSENLEGKSLEDVFRPKQYVSVSSEKQLGKKSWLNAKEIKEHLIKGVASVSEQKMVSQQSQYPIVFRGDLSTILQSSNEQDSSLLQSAEKKTEKHSAKDVFPEKNVMLSLLEKKQKNQPDIPLSMDKKRHNPFLTSYANSVNKSDSKIESRQKKTQNLVESMKNKLFNNSKGQSKTIQANKSENSSSKIFFTQVFDSHSKNSTEILPSISSHPIISSFPTFIPPVSNCERTFKTNSGSSSHQASIFPSFNYQHTQNQSKPMFDKSFQSQINCTVKSSLLNDDKNKAILNSFLQPSCNSLSLGRFASSGSLFTKQSSKELEDDFDRKTERRCRMETKKKKNKQERIRG